MLLLSALFALFAGGFWLYCLADVALTPSNEFGRLPKAAWIAVVVGTFVIGAVAWLAVRRPAQPTVASLPRDPAGEPGPGPGTPRAQRGRSRPGKGPGKAKPGGRGPAGQMRPAGPVSPADAAVALVSPVGPDDDPEFLRALDRAIHSTDAGDDPAAAG